MLIFKPVNVKSSARLRKYYKNCPYRLCEYSVGVKLMWRHHMDPCFAESNGCLIVRNSYHGGASFDYPVPLDDSADLNAALDEIDDYCRANGILPAFQTVPEDALPVLLHRYPYTTVTNGRTWQDYLYNAQDLATFAGRRYSGQRNHINKFHKLYPAAVFRPITKADSEELETFWDEFHLAFNKENAMAKKELCYARKLTRQIGKSWVLAGALELEGKFIAISLGEICGSTLICHIEKALPGYEGVYPTMVQSFASYYGKDCLWINREDDSADKGLRTSKTQYLPSDMGRKYRVAVSTDLWNLDRVPALQSERLTMDAMTRADIPAYNRLCLDDARNRWWGYDYRKDLKGELTENYFYRVAQKDFKRKLAVNFAIRLDGQFIGEAVLYNFDYKGAAELGCRILPEFAGHGYGAEAFRRLADWTLYELGLYRLVAKCYKENTPSYQMLSAVMRQTGEDDTFYHFEKLI